MTIKGRLYSTCPMLKAFSSEKVPKNGGFGCKNYFGDMLIVRIGDCCTAVLVIA